MRCKKCGQVNEDSANFCDNCGASLTRTIDNDSQKTKVEIKQNKPIKNSNGEGSAIAGIACILGGIISIAGSFQMKDIQSVSGDSIAEAFYNAFGTFGIGLGIFMIGIGIYILTKNKKVI